MIIAGSLCFVHIRTIIVRTGDWTYTVLQPFLGWKSDDNPPPPPASAPARVIGGVKQLFADASLVGSMAGGARLAMHQPQKMPAPVLRRSA